MKSTPLKPHYLFSMKDMTRLVEGISMINKLNCDSRNVFLKLIIHETNRVYSDKMFNLEDKDFINKLIKEEIEMIYGVGFDDLINKINPNIFTNFFDIQK